MENYIQNHSQQFQPTGPVSNSKNKYSLLSDFLIRNQSFSRQFSNRASLNMPVQPLNPASCTAGRQNAFTDNSRNSPPCFFLCKQCLGNTQQEKWKETKEFTTMGQKRLLDRNHTNLVPQNFLCTSLFCYVSVKY